RDGEPLGHEARHRYLVGVGLAEIARCHAGDPMEVAKRQGFVQAETVAQRGHRVRARVQSEHVGSRVARNDLDHGEDDEARRYKAEGERDETSEERAQHAGPLPGAEARAKARGGPEGGANAGQARLDKAATAETEPRPPPQVDRGDTL